MAVIYADLIIKGLRTLEEVKKSFPTLAVEVEKILERRTAERS